MTLLRVLVADDHAVIRTSLAHLIDAEADLTVVGGASDGTAAVRMAIRLVPNVLVLDLSMPGGGGLQAISRLRDAVPELRCLVLSRHDSESRRKAAFEAGARGFVAKRSAAKVLIDAIRAVADGRIFSETTASLEPTTPTLSQRERQVVHLVARGYVSKEIGAKLGIAAGTVDVYRRRAAKKLGLSSRSELVRFAIERGLLDDEGDPR